MTKKQSPLTAKQIQNLKYLLLESRIKVQSTIEELEKQDPFNDPDHVNDNAAIDTDVREQLGHDTIEAEVESLKKKLDLIERALKKVEKKTYGICEKHQEPIQYERLELVPEARFCIEYEKKRLGER